MANFAATIMGVLFILLGAAGFFLNNLLGAHLSPMHNLIHLISGAASLYFGVKGSPYATKLFCLIFGFFYLSLAVVGYWFGYNHMETYLPNAVADHGYNQDMFHVIPGVFELGVADHLIHVVIGAIYIGAAVLTRTNRNAAEFFEGNPE